MDWLECTGKNIVKDVKPDRNLIVSAQKIASVKVESANALPKHLYIGKITLLYDALREYLECVALENGYKIYNHECYAAFLKEILGKKKEAEIFNNLRKVRNGINYYGKYVSEAEAAQIIADLNILIAAFKNKTKLNHK